MGWGFPGGASGKEPACQCRRRKRSRFDPWVWIDSPGGGHSHPLHYCPENPMVRGAWWVTVHGGAESDTTEPLSMRAWDPLAAADLEAMLKEGNQVVAVKRTRSDFCLKDMLLFSS